eukprot:gene7938-9765_t
MDVYCGISRVWKFSLFTLDRFSLFFDCETLPTSNEEEENDLKDNEDLEPYNYSFQFLEIIQPRKLKISTSNYDMTMPLRCVDNVLKYESIRSVKFGIHPTPYEFLEKALSSTSRIQSLRIEVRNWNWTEFNEPLDKEERDENYPDIETLIFNSQNSNLRRLVIKDMNPKNYPKIFNSLITNKHHSSIKALGLSTEFVHSKKNSLVKGLPVTIDSIENKTDIDLSPLLQLPNIDTLYCNIDQLQLYLNHATFQNQNIKILKCIIDETLLFVPVQESLIKFIKDHYNINNNKPTLEKLYLLSISINLIESRGISKGFLIAQPSAPEDLRHYRVNVDGSGWRPREPIVDSFIYVGSESIKEFNKIELQTVTVSATEIEYIKSFKIKYTFDGEHEYSYLNSSTLTIITDMSNIIGRYYYTFNPPLIARSIKIIPVTWNLRPSAKLEVWTTPVRVVQSGTVRSLGPNIYTPLPDGSGGWLSRDDVKRVNFEKKFPCRNPRIAISISALSHSQSTDTMIVVDAKNISNTGFDAIFGSWGNSVTWDVIATWIATCEHVPYPDFEVDP